MTKIKKALAIELPYIGANLSVNHYKFGYYTKRETREWMEMLGWFIKPHHIDEWDLPLTVRVSGYFKDKRSTPDLSNLSKVILDAIEDTTGVNDKHMRWQDGEVGQSDEPYLKIEIMEGK